MVRFLQDLLFSAALSATVVVPNMLTFTLAFFLIGCFVWRGFNDGYNEVGS